MLKIWSYKVIISIVIDFAYVYKLEIADKIFPGKEKDTIFFLFTRCILIVKELFIRGINTVPEVEIIVTSSTLPLFMTPRVS